MIRAAPGGLACGEHKREPVGLPSGGVVTQPEKVGAV